MRRWSVFVCVYPSQPYVAIGKMRLFINWTLVSLVISRDFHIFDRDCIALLPMPSLFLMSISQSPFSCNVDPRYTKDVTCCNFWPFVIILISILSFDNIMTLVFSMMRLRPVFTLALGTLPTNSCRSWGYCVSTIVKIGWFLTELFKI